MFDVYFAPPGVGKTTFAAYLSVWYRKKYIKKDSSLNIYCNFPLSGTYLIDKDDIGKVLISDGLLILDEAGVEFNSRAFKSFDGDKIKFFKYHRHFSLDCVVLSQGYDDMDKILRTLCTRMFLLRRRPILPIISAVRIHKKIDIDDHSHQPIDFYYFDHSLLQILTNKRIWAPKYYKLFNSFERYPLPVKEFKKTA